MTQTLQRPAPAAIGRPRPVLNFAWHFAEMCAAMCLAWMLVTIPFIASAKAAGTADPVRQWPELATVLAVTAMSAGMAAEMRWRGHAWACIGEMTAAMVMAGLVVFALAAVGALPRSAEFGWFHGLMPLAMIVPMLRRRDLYTAPVTHRRGAAPDT